MSTSESKDICSLLTQNHVLQSSFLISQPRNQDDFAQKTFASGPRLACLYLYIYIIVYLDFVR